MIYRLSEIYPSIIVAHLKRILKLDRLRHAVQTPYGLRAPMAAAITWPYGSGRRSAAFATQVEATRRARNALRFIPGILL